MKNYPVYLRLNYETDGDIIARLKKVKKQTYIKRLIREDLEKRSSEGWKNDLFQF